MKQDAAPSRGPKSSSLGLSLISVLALIGLGLNIYLSLHFYSVRGGTAGFKSACNFGAAMNCDAVAASPYAELAFGIPLSSFGAGWFLALFVISLCSRLAEWVREGARVVFAMTLFGTLISLYYLFVMSVLIKTYCVFCLGVEGISFVSLLVAWFTLKPEKSGKPSGSVWQTSGIILGISLVVTTVFLRNQDEMSMTRDEVTDRTNSVLTTPVVAVGAGDEFPSIGPKDAPVTVVEFSDFQCPFCRLGAFMLNTVLNRYPGKVRVVFRNFPLNPGCNPSITHAMHDFACDAAKAGYCASRQGKFEPAYQALFENQASFGSGDTTKPEAFVKGTGVDAGQLQACEASTEAATAISRDVEEGSHLGVQSTPTFFVNGHKMEGVVPVKVWDALISQLAPQAK